MTDNNGSYIQELSKKTLCNVQNLRSTNPDSGPVHQDTANNNIFAYLKKIYDTTKALGQQVQQIEINHLMLHLLDLSHTHMIPTDQTHFS